MTPIKIKQPIGPHDLLSNFYHPICVSIGVWMLTCVKCLLDICRCPDTKSHIGVTLIWFLYTVEPCVRVFYQPPIRKTPYVPRCNHDLYLNSKITPSILCKNNRKPVTDNHVYHRLCVRLTGVRSLHLRRGVINWNLRFYPHLNLCGTFLEWSFEIP